MRLHELFGDEPGSSMDFLLEFGKIVKNVNTTIDVQPGEIQRQAAKFGNNLDANGNPPTFKGGRGQSTNAADMVNKGDDWYGRDGTRPGPGHTGQEWPGPGGKDSAK